MNNPIEKKLTLKRETLRELTNAELRLVAGAQGWTLETKGTSCQ